MSYELVTVETFREAILSAGQDRPLIAQATTYADELPEGARYYLESDGQSGYGLNGEELVGVFSTVRGRGAVLVNHAIAQGARRLDCFDGHLPTFYERFGFREDRREANWTAGEPDVVYMRLVV